MFIPGDVQYNLGLLLLFFQVLRPPCSLPTCCLWFPPLLCTQSPSTSATTSTATSMLWSSPARLSPSIRPTADAGFPNTSSTHMIPHTLYTNRSMGTKGRATPRVVCCAIPISRAAGKVLVVTSRKRPHHWVCESSSPCLYSVPTLFHYETRITTKYFSTHFLPRLACRDLLLTFIFVLVPKGGFEPTDIQLEAAASREALEEGLAVCHLRLVTS